MQTIKPKLGEEIEYRISFKNTVENGKLVEVKVEDEIPAGLEYVENSLQAEGSKPSPVELKFENGKVMAKYLEITDTKERSIIFKVRVKEEAEIGKEIVNKAIVVDTKMSRRASWKLLRNIKMVKLLRRKWRIIINRN